LENALDGAETVVDLSTSSYTDPEHPGR